MTNLDTLDAELQYRQIQQPIRTVHGDNEVFR